jgi:mono/diheme cytochrome c family protein
LALPELHRTWRPLIAAGAAALVAALAVGCGEDGSSSADLVNGKKLFVGEGTCGSCHTLARAGSKGIQGPNLDNAFQNARDHGFGDSVIEGVVRAQIDHPRRSSIMKADLVTGDDARDVAAYVGDVAGKPGKDSGLLASVGVTDVSGKTAVEKGGKLEIPADPTGALSFQFGKATASAGAVEIAMPNPASIDHNIAIKGPVNGKGPVVGQGGTSSFKATLKPGTYEFLCEVPGHEAGGMKGTLTVK